MKKIYLAGPEVFLTYATSVSIMKKNLCFLYGFDGLFPLDNDVATHTDRYMQGAAIGTANLELIQSADLVIANITPFRGCNCDVGTAFEIGYAAALGKPVFAYTSEDRLHLQRLKDNLPYGVYEKDGVFLDHNDMVCEDFEMVDNLMLDTVFESITTRKAVLKEDYYNNLLAFEGALKQAQQYYKLKKANMQLGIYKHYKNKLYKVHFIGKHSETQDDLVIYQSLWGEYGIWVRPLVMFQENIDHLGTKRFLFISNELTHKLIDEYAIEEHKVL